MAAGIGIDVIEIERIERALERRPRLRERLFTRAELAYADARARPGRHLAARFAAKEAVIKALGAERVGPGSIEVVATGGPPEVRLTGAAAEAAGGPRDLGLAHAFARDGRRGGPRPAARPSRG